MLTRIGAFCFQLSQAFHDENPKAVRETVNVRQPAIGAEALGFEDAVETAGRLRIAELAIRRLPGAAQDLKIPQLGAAQSQSPSAWRLVEVTVGDQAASFTYALRRNKLREVRRREGRYLLRTSLTSSDPAERWRYYIQLVQVEQAFKDLEGDLAVRPIYHQLEHRIDAHIFIAFLPYCLHVTLAQQIQSHASGLTPRSVLDKFAAVQMLDVHILTADGRELVFTRYTEPEREIKLLLERLNLELPAQPPPRITATQADAVTSV